MYKNVIDPGKSVYFVLKDIDIGGQIQYLMCTGPLFLYVKIIFQGVYQLTIINESFMSQNRFPVIFDS